MKISYKVAVYVGITLLLISSLIWGYKKYDSWANYRYGINEIYIDHSATNKTFNISVTNVRKEMGKEDIFEFECETVPNKSGEQNSNFDISFSLPKSEFEHIIGSNNNSLSSQIYVLRVGISSKVRPSSEKITIYRYSCFGESDFNEEEIHDISVVARDIFNIPGLHEFDLSMLKEQIKSTRLFSSWVQSRSIRTFIDQSIQR